MTKGYSGNMIELKGLTKIYRGQSVAAVDHVDLTIKSGEFFGLLGSNGAGKTSIVGMITTLLLPSSGEVLIDGEKLLRSRPEIKAKIGLTTQEYSLSSELTAYQVMQLQGMLHHLPRKLVHEKTEELFRFAGLMEHRDKQVMFMSGGMKRKLMLCRALLTDPQIVILDEPTVGLDPFSRRQMWELLSDLHRQGKTLILTTHYIEEAQAMCDRVAFMENGRLIKTGSPTALISELGEYCVENSAHSCCRYFQDKRAALDSAALGSDSVVVRQSTLEDVFLETIGHKLED